MKWTLFDYGVGNLHSLRKAVASTGRDVVVTANPDDLASAEAILLPGVGAFGAVMASLEPARDALAAHVAAGRPLLGICIGMQVLYEGSEETPDVPGLGVLPGTVARLHGPKVPHMGWAHLADQRDPLAAAEMMYFVHSYAAPPTHDALATAEYGTRFAAAAGRAKTLGVQFHPEKSSTAGKAVLANLLTFLETP